MWVLTISNEKQEMPKKLVFKRSCFYIARNKKKMMSSKVDMPGEWFVSSNVCKINIIKIGRMPSNV